MKPDLIEQFWQEYLATLPPDAPAHREVYLAEGFGDSPRMADELGALVVAGAKTATCSALWEWQASGEPLPQVGDKMIVLAGDQTPLCLIETTEVAIRPFNEVDARFAAEEGEGDRSLAYWREAHWRYFSRTLPQIGKTPTEEMPLVCERFRVIHRR